MSLPRPVYRIIKRVKITLFLCLLVHGSDLNGQTHALTIGSGGMVYGMRGEHINLDNGTPGNGFSSMERSSMLGRPGASVLVGYEFIARNKQLQFELNYVGNYTTAMLTGSSSSSSWFGSTSSNFQFEQTLYVSQVQLAFLHRPFSAKWTGGFGGGITFPVATAIVENSVEGWQEQCVFGVGCERTPYELNMNPLYPGSAGALITAEAERAFIKNAIGCKIDVWIGFNTIRSNYDQVAASDYRPHGARVMLYYKFRSSHAAEYLAFPPGQFDERSGRFYDW